MACDGLRHSPISVVAGVLGESHLKYCKTASTIAKGRRTSAVCNSTDQRPGASTYLNKTDEVGGARAWLSITKIVFSRHGQSPRTHSVCGLTLAYKPRYAFVVSRHNCRRIARCRVGAWVVVYP